MSLMIGFLLGILLTIVITGALEGPFRWNARHAMETGAETCFVVRAPHPLAGLYCMKWIETEIEPDPPAT